MTTNTKVLAGVGAAVVAAGTLQFLYTRSERFAAAAAEGNFEAAEAPANVAFHVGGVMPIVVPASVLLLLMLAAGAEPSTSSGSSGKGGRAGVKFRYPNDTSYPVPL